MPNREPTPIVGPFQNRGLVLKVEAASLQVGQLAELTNMTSTQEGSINVRNGCQKLTDTTAFGGATLMHTITKFKQTASMDVRYFGESQDIWRIAGDLPAGGAGYGSHLPGSLNPSVKVAFNTSESVVFSGQRWTGVQFNAGATGTPYEYFACPAKMLKDDGTLTNGDGSPDGTLINRWGIIPPCAAAEADLDQITVLPSTDVISANGGSSATGRVSTTIASIVSSPTLGGAGVYEVEPTVATGIIVGQLLNINSGTLVIVTDTSTDPSIPRSTFTAYFPVAPVAAQTVTSSEVNQTLDASTSAPSAGNGIFEFSIAVPGAGFNGMPPDYTTNDVVHVSIGIAEPTKVSDIRLRVMVGASYSLTGADYYEKSIAISVAQSTTDLSQTAATQLDTTVPQSQIGIYGDYEPVDSLSQDVKPVVLDPVSPNQSTSVPLYTENDIVKGDFVAVGRAGSGSFTWKNVVGFQVIAKSNVTASLPKIWVSSIYVAGGFGPDAFSRSATNPLFPYDYLYTYRNVLTGTESNPSVPMIQPNYVTPGRQAVVLTLCGTGDPQVSTGLQSFSMGIYRRGGSYSDGLYRLVGYATNKGAPEIDGNNNNSNAITFVDNQPDINLLYAPILEFDNDPPVTSTLPNLYRFGFSNYTQGTGAAGQYSTLNMVYITLTGTDLTDILRPGTLMTFARGTPKEEVVAVISVTSGNFVQVFFQYDHSDFSGFTSIVAEADATTGQPCQLAVAAFDSVFVAGDINNPHVVYKSKTGRPEAFPVVELSTGISGSQIVGSPSNPIMNFCEYSGGLLFLNLDRLYYMTVAFGAMQVPIETPATRGLIGRNAWCKADNEIWYLSYDGIYSWSGGQSIKRSEAIDPLFKGVQIGPYPPIDLTQNEDIVGSNIAMMQYMKNEIFMVYSAIGGGYYRLRYSTIYDRWSIETFKDPLSGSTSNPITAMNAEADDGILLFATQVQTSPPALAYLYRDDVGQSDGWITEGDTVTGVGIDYALKSAGFELQQATMQKQYLDLMIELNNDLASIPATMKWEMFYDWSGTADPTDTFAITTPIAGGRRRQQVSFQLGFGKEAYTAQIRISGTSTALSSMATSVVPVTFYSFNMNYYPLTQIQVGRTWDWDDLGYQYDKRLYQLIVTYDIPVGQSVTLNLDTITGIAGLQSENTATQTFTLLPPTTSATGAPTRLTANFWLKDVLIVKQVRLRPTVAGFQFKYFNYSFGEMEKLPADIVAFTPWNNYGSEYDKYAQQIDLNVDTGGVAGTVTLQADDATVAGPFTVTTTSENRQVNLTMPPQIIGKMFRLLNTAGAGGKFQLYDHKIIMLPADRGPVMHSYDWDYLEWPYDKHLKELTIEYDLSYNGPTPTTVYMDTMTGIKGGTITIHPYSFILDQTGRALQTFPFDAGVYVKQVRLYPQADTTIFKEWKYRFDFDKMPADIVEFTDWKDLGWPCQKIFRSLEIELNTDGVDCAVQLQLDGTTVYSFVINSTINNRRRIITLPSDLVGINERLLFTPGTNGAAQYFAHSYEFIKEPCAVSHWDSYETTFGYDGWSFIKQVWLQYISPSPITVSFYSDGGTLFYQKTLPAHPQRDVERFYLPAWQFTNNQFVLNKSKRHRIMVDETNNPFRFYPDASRVEWQPIGIAQRQGYQQLAWSEITAIDTGFGVGMQ